MDMPISHINTRLFALLPPQLDLGLLFATGTVSQIIWTGGGRPIQFTLRDAGYALRCKVARNVKPDFELAEGQLVRATGHLSFSSQAARFHLVLRDLELLPDLESGPSRTPAADHPSGTPREVASESLRGTPAVDVLAAIGDIPAWVYQLAPREVRNSVAGWGVQRVEKAIEGGLVDSFGGQYQAAADMRSKENVGLLGFLLGALERSEREDVELSAEVLDQYRMRSPTLPVSPPTTRVAAVEAGAVPTFVTSKWWLRLAVVAFLLGTALIVIHFLLRFGIL
jgi:hypothetical protein